MQTGEADVVTVQYSDLADPSCDLTSSIAEVRWGSVGMLSCGEGASRRPTAVTSPPRRWMSPQAYGPRGLGILLVAGVPQLPELRQQLLPLAQRFAVRHCYVKA